MNKNFLKIAENLIAHSKDKNALAFIFKTKVHAIMVFYIYGSKKITFENLCSAINGTASRSTIQSILIEGVKKSYISKITNIKDKRQKYYNCNNLHTLLEKWFLENKAIFNLK